MVEVTSGDQEKGLCLKVGSSSRTDLCRGYLTSDLSLGQTLLSFRLCLTSDLWTRPGRVGLVRSCQVYPGLSSLSSVYS